jgi:hypothetical protein
MKKPASASFGKIQLAGARSPEVVRDEQVEASKLPYFWSIPCNSVSSLANPRLKN